VFALRASHLRFVAMMLLYGAVVALFYREEVLGQSLAPLTVLTARVTCYLLRTGGVEALQEGAVLTHPAGFSYEVGYTCTGFLPVATLMVCILAYPESFRTKPLGILLGSAALIGINLLRLTSLFYIGIHFPDSFALAHEVVWELLWVVAFIALWFGWIQWAGNRVARHVSPPLTAP
jgi:exosortase/archaeosortase family protein